MYVGDSREHKHLGMFHCSTCIHIDTNNLLSFRISLRTTNPDSVKDVLKALRTSVVYLILKCSGRQCSMSHCREQICPCRRSYDGRDCIACYMSPTELKLNARHYFIALLSCTSMQNMVLFTLFDSSGKTPIGKTSL